MSKAHVLLSWSLQELASVIFGSTTLFRPILSEKKHEKEQSVLLCVLLDLLTKINMSIGLSFVISEDRDLLTICNRHLSLSLH
mmetsp:Transcript_16092/g.24321  ORF Transcript_16092/g.24321 Transcript_16092/m.24321 type:complete len:83 (+) Transcript_16092:865-1113(+)